LRRVRIRNKVLAMAVSQTLEKRTRSRQGTARETIH
jgi:hypothetical protein